MTLTVFEQDFFDMDFIHRFQATPEGSPPWVGISFKEGVESDELAAQLKEKYPSPEYKTLRERKHKATIDFLIWELERMTTKDPSTPSISKALDLASSPGLQNEMRTCIEISPDRSRPQSASSYTSPSHTGSVHSPATSDRGMLGGKPKAGVVSSPPHSTSQQLVWNSQTGQLMRPKTKRKMTVEERKAYKKTREQGACDACRKQKARVFTT
jgi:hypothetical protein